MGRGQSSIKKNSPPSSQPPWPCSHLHLFSTVTSQHCGWGHLSQEAGTHGSVLTDSSKLQRDLFGVWGKRHLGSPWLSSHSGALNSFKRKTQVYLFPSRPDTLECSCQLALQLCTQQINVCNLGTENEHFCEDQGVGWGQADRRLGSCSLFPPPETLAFPSPTPYL